MAKLMKVCPKCYTWTNSSKPNCEKCTTILLSTTLTDIFWSKATPEEKTAYTRKYCKYASQEEHETALRAAVTVPRQDRSEPSELDSLKIQNLTGYYEYSVEIVKSIKGKPDIISLTRILNEKGREGWKLTSSHAEEHIIVDTEETQNYTVLIFERLVRFDV